MILLEVVGPYPPEGYQDEEGVEWYNDTVISKWGQVGNLKIEDGVIKQTPGVALISREAVEKQEIATIKTSPLGFSTVRFVADNGEVEYMLHDEHVGWADKPEVVVPFSLATLTFRDWIEDAEDNG